MSESAVHDPELKDLIQRVLLEFEDIITRIIERPVLRTERAEPGAGIGVVAFNGAVPSEPA